MPKEKKTEIGIGNIPMAKGKEVTMKEISTQNNFEVLSTPDEQVPSSLEEGELPQFQVQREENKATSETFQGYSIDGLSPTYAEMAKKKKTMANSGSFEDESFEKSSKKGWKSHKIVREEEAEG